MVLTKTAGFVPGNLGGSEGGGGEAAPVQVPEPNAEAVARLADMGFPEAVARRALLLTRNRLEAATEWCLSHSDDPDAADPPSQEQLRRVYGRAAAAARAMPVVMEAADPALVQQLKEMGFPEDMVRFLVAQPHIVRPPVTAPSWGHADARAAHVKALLLSCLVRCLRRPWQRQWLPSSMLRPRTRASYTYLARSALLHMSRLFPALRRAVAGGPAEVRQRRGDGVPGAAVGRRPGGRGRRRRRGPCACRARA